MVPQEVSLLEIIMLPNGYSVRTFRELNDPDMGYMRERLADILTLLAKELRSPFSQDSVPVEVGDQTGSLIMVREPASIRTKH